MARHRYYFALLAGLLFVILAALVATRTTDHLDSVVREWFWPHHEWGPTQARADHFANLFSPPRLALGALAVSALISLRRHSMAPLWLTLAVVFIGGAAEVSVKWLMPRVAVPTLSAHFAGSFPSGHIVAAVAFPGAIVLLLHTKAARVGWLAVGVFALGMGVALLVSAIHYLTDVIGGIMLAVTVLLAISALPLTGARLLKRSLRSGDAGLYGSNTCD